MEVGSSPLKTILGNMPKQKSDRLNYYHVRDRQLRKTLFRSMDRMCVFEHIFCIRTISIRTEIRMELASLKVVDSLKLFHFSYKIVRYLQPTELKDIP